MQKKGHQANSNTKTREKTTQQKPCVFITGLSHLLEKNTKLLLKILKDHISGADKVSIPKSQKGKLSGYAFLYLKDFTFIKPALQVKSIIIDENRSLLVKPFRTGKSLQNYKRDEGKRRLFVKGIPHDLTSDDLREALKSIGELEDAFIMINKSNDQSKGIGIAVFKRKKDAERAVKIKHIRFIDGRTCSVYPYKSKEIIDEKKNGGNSDLKKEKKNSSYVKKSTKLEKDFIEVNHKIKPTNKIYFSLRTKVFRLRDFKIGNQKYRINKAGMK